MSIFRFFKANSPDHSKSNAYLLSLLSYYIYDQSGQSVTRHNHALNFRNICENLSNSSAAEKFTVRLYGGGPIIGSFPYDTEAALLHNQQVAIIVFRGTEGIPIPGINPNFWSSVRDWLNNVQHNLIQPTQNWSGRVHQGFYQALNQVYGQIRADLRPIVANNPDIHVFLTGHSLGGSLATLCAYRMERFDNVIRVSGVYTFGAPRVGNNLWAVTAYNGLPSRHASLQECTHRWVNDTDFGPRVPFGGQGVDEWSHVGRLNYVDGNGNVELDRPNGNQLPVGVPVLDHHDMTRYCRIMFRELSADDAAGRDWLIREDVENVVGIW